MDTDIWESLMQSNSNPNIDSMNFKKGDVQVETSGDYPKIKLVIRWRKLFAPLEERCYCTFIGTKYWL